MEAAAAAVQDVARQTKYPRRVDGGTDPTMEIWYKLDRTFKLPKAIVCMHFVSPLSASSCSAVVIMELYLKLLSYQLSEQIYPAALAQLFCGVTLSQRGGFQVQVTGFNHKLPLLLRTVVRQMRDVCEAPHFDERLFEMIRDESKKSFKNDLLSGRSMTHQLRMRIIQPDYYSVVEMYHALTRVTLTELVQFVGAFWSSFYVQCLVQGNMSRAQAVSVCDEAVAVLRSSFGDGRRRPENPSTGAPWTKETLPYPRIREIPTGKKAVCMRALNKNDGNSMTVNYYQWGAGNLCRHVRMSLLIHIMEERLYNSLRTKEQLGYDVHTSVKNSYGVLGFAVTVQSVAKKFDTAYIEQRISEFLNTFLTQTLVTMAASEFSKEVEGLIKIKEVVYDNLSQEVRDNMDEIKNEEYIFDRKTQEIELLKKTTLEDLRQLLTELLTTNSDRNRILSVQLQGYANVKEETAGMDGNGDQGGGENAVVSSGDHESGLNLLDERDIKWSLIDGSGQNQSHVNSDFYIKDIDKFSEPLKVFPRCKIVNDVHES